MDKNDKEKRTLILAKSNYSAADDIDLYMQGGLLVPRNEPRPLRTPSGNSARCEISCSNSSTEAFTSFAETAPGKNPRT